MFCSKGKRNQKKSAADSSTSSVSPGIKDLTERRCIANVKKLVNETQGVIGHLDASDLSLTLENEIRTVLPSGPPTPKRVNARTVRFGLP
jgi:hypothetical protein